MNKVEKINKLVNETIDMTKDTEYIVNASGVKSIGIKNRKFFISFTNGLTNTYPDYPRFSLSLGRILKSNQDAENVIRMMLQGIK